MNEKEINRRAKISKSSKGKIKSIEHRRNLSKALTGRKLSLVVRKKKSESMKKKWANDIEYRMRMVEAHIGNPYTGGGGPKGSKNFNWKGGKSFEKYTIDWTKTLKESIRERDGHLCRFCRRRQEQLSRILCIHHIDYNKKNCNPENLISLCINCHVRTNQHRVRWTEYFKLLLELWK